MSPGLAKRIASNNQGESFIYTNEMTPSTTATATASSFPASSKKQQQTINNNSNAQVKIQNALERNMQKLKLQSNKFNNGRQTASNWSREDIELFTSPTNTSNAATAVSAAADVQLTKQKYYSLILKIEFFLNLS